MAHHLSLLRRGLPHLFIVLFASSCSKGCGEAEQAGSGRAPSASASASAPASAAVAPPAEIPLDERKQIAGQISFVSERDGNREVYLVGLDGTGERRLTSSPAAEYNGPACADGTALLLIRTEPNEGPQQLLFQPLDGSPARPLGPSTGRVRFPSFSPDGRWVVYEAGGDKKDPTQFADIYRINRDGSGSSRLTKNPEGNFEPALSPRGDAIVLVSSRDRVAELYRIRPDGSDPVRLTDTQRDEWGARFSPDGEELVFVSDRDGADRIYTMPAKGGPTVRVSQRDLDTHVVEDHPSYSPVGKKLAYMLSVPPAPSRVVLADFETGREIEVTAPDGAGQVTDPVWLPDGRYLMVTITRGQEPQIYRVRADGTGLTRITSSSGGNWNPQWVPQRQSKPQ